VITFATAKCKRWSGAVHAAGDACRAGGAAGRSRGWNDRLPPDDRPRSRDGCRLVGRLDFDRRIPCDGPAFRWPWLGLDL